MLVYGKINSPKLLSCGWVCVVRIDTIKHMNLHELDAHLEGRRLTKGLNSYCRTRLLFCIAPEQF